MQHILNSHRSIIFLNGILPHQKLFSLINTDVTIIAADGAAEKVYSAGLRPTYIVGDGDSYTNQDCDTTRHEQSLACGFSGVLDSPQIVKIADQDTTDFEKCLFVAQQKNLAPCLVLGIGGGEIDHAIGNMQVLLKHAPQISCYFLDTYVNARTNAIGIKLGVLIINQKLKFSVHPGSTVSIIWFEEACLTTHGLKWELNDHRFSFDGVLGLRNECLSDRVEFEVKRGRVLLIFDIGDFFSLPIL